MKNILVTGGAGFIGSHITSVLLERGYNVFVIDSFVNSSPKALEKVLEIQKKKYNSNLNLSIFEGDILNKSFLKNVFLEISQNKKIDGVIHLAGLKSVSESIKNPIKYWRSNILGTLNLLEIMSRFKCEIIVFSSSATIYEQKANLKLRETSKLNPVNPYGNTKLSIENILRDHCNSLDGELRYACLRYFNPIGAHESGHLGEYPKGIPNNIFPIINDTALGIQKELKIFGKDWPTRDGTPIRDFIHIMDLAEAHLKILECLISKKESNFYLNIGTGKGTSVLELIKTFEKVNNLKINYTFSSRRPGDFPFAVADNSLLISKFNFVPKRTIEDMCRDGRKWRVLNPNGFN